MLHFQTRDEEMLKEWRQETKKINQKKQYDSMIKGTKGNQWKSTRKAIWIHDKRGQKVIMSKLLP